MSHADLYGDTDYRKQEKPLLVELIEKANPGFSEKAPLDQIEFAYPQAVAPTAENPDDTAIAVRAAQGSTAIVGQRSVTYRRIDLSKLFRGRTLVVTRWSATNALPYADLRTLLLEQCGVNCGVGSGHSHRVDCRRWFALLQRSDHCCVGER